MVHILLAEGFEEIEALTVVDLLRRAGVSAQMVSITGRVVVTGCHGIRVTADSTLSEEALCSSEMIILPGGLPGATNLEQDPRVIKALHHQHKEGKPIAAICAAPFILGKEGLLRGLRATCYPGFESSLTGAVPTGALVERDGNIITGKGPAAAMPFALEIVRLLLGENTSNSIAKGLLFL